ncbi:LuxR family transcriptional regulator [Kitasatospora sp. MAP5-34]|uniref:helix-turn-helix transcriptional regulator n=1 Tax=Kitasatospora sp. MAP5-34 TaxID=3035102 RepID=UPI002476960A|nr:LuxR family transcriptional regulator [Kitasatospora sp. MAP5-34]MDH6575057.1 DNA-binding CsgD family transcriptional regulator [Kitasatospora sp. MAP5-34]
MPSRAIGRAELLATASDLLREHTAVLLYGPLGIGKSTVAAALAAEARRSGVTVLRCAPAERERELPFVSLIDLLRRVPDDRIDALAPGPRTALRTALLRAEYPAGDLGRLVVPVAVAELLRALAPVLLVLDGIQWLDRPSAEVLDFVARRAGRLGVRVLATERVPEGELPGDRAPGTPEPCPPGTAELRIPPLPPAALAQLLAARPGARQLAPELREIGRAAAGNPHYALELARTTGPHAPGEDLPVPKRLRVLLLDRLRDLPDEARHVLLLAAAAARPTTALLTAAGAADAPSGLALGAALGILDLAADGSARFRHPLLPAALLADAPRAARQRAHQALAAVAPEPAERARHLALSRPEQNEPVAAELTGAAVAARRRGAHRTAYELAALAAARTPAGTPAPRWDRLLAAAGYASDGGLPEEARRAVRPVLDHRPGVTPAPDLALRTRARLALLRAAGQALHDSGEVIRDGLLDTAGHPGLAAPLWHWAAVRELLGGRTAPAAEYAARAAELAAEPSAAEPSAAEPAATDPRAAATRAAALGLLGTVRAMRGEYAEAERTLRGARVFAAESGLPVAVLSGLLRRQALVELDADRVTAARARIAELRALPSEGAEVEETLATLVAAVRVDVRAGRCRSALDAAERCRRLLADSGVRSAPAAYATALAELAGGELRRAAELAAEAVEAASSDGDQLFLIRSTEVLAHTRLLTGEPAATALAVEALQSARAAAADMELADAAAVHRLALLAEGLVALGEHGEAAQVLAEGRALLGREAGRAPAGSAVAALDRADGLRQAALGRPAEGVTLLRGAAERLRGLELPLELAATLTALGAVERRARRRAAARAALVEARELCLGLAARPLRERAERELRRLGPGDRSGVATVRLTAQQLTAGEHRVADLVAEGATNREVAAALFVSVKTVEGTLSRIYRKLGVSSRMTLARVLAAR